MSAKSSYAVQKIIERAVKAVESNGYVVTDTEVRSDGVIHLDLDSTPETGRRVYFLQGKRTKLIKIGVANSVARRMRDIQNMSPDKLLLLCDLHGTAADEARLHSILRVHRVWGEWFTGGAWIKHVNACARLGKSAKDLIERLEAHKP